MADIKKIAVMGMGYVGLTLSVVLAKRGFDVSGIEINKDVVEKLKGGDPHFEEKGLKSLLSHYLKQGNLRILEGLPDEEYDAYVISVGTPLLKDLKEPNLSYMDNVLKDVAEHMKKGSTIILRSTVPVGFSRDVAIPKLEEISGMKAGEDFNFVFAPERTAEGKALVELESLPQVVGGISEESISLATTLFRKITPIILNVSSLEAAEMIKIIDNSYRDMTFAYANEIALICEKLGLDALELVTNANAHYKRTNVPVPSPGVGGACLSKDPHILAYFSKNKGYDAKLIKEARDVNEKIPGQIVDRISEMLSEKGKSLGSSKIFIVGFAFKGNPETSDLRDSTTIWFLDELKKKTGMENVFGYDPVVSEKEIDDLGVKFATIEEGCRDADVVLFMNNHESYRHLDSFRLCELMSDDSVFYDSWRMFEKELFEKNDKVRYIGVGI